MSTSRREAGKARSAGRAPKARAAESAPKRTGKQAAKADLKRPPPKPPAGSSRLTIRAGAPGAARAPLVLSTKPRPPGQRRLSEVELDEDEVLIDSFSALLEGVSVRITAVLERTCVYLDPDGDHRLARKKDLWVEADKLPIRRRGIG